MEYLVTILNIIQAEANRVSFFDYTENVLTLANEVIALVVIIIGLSWITPLKEKQHAASFSFWSQVRIRLIRISGYLKSDDKLLFYLYSSGARIEWNGKLGPNPDDCKPLKDAVEETLSFLQDADDQMPPYAGWTDDYTELLNSLTDIIVFDICDSESKYKYLTPVDYSELSELSKTKYLHLDAICEKIENKQKEIEKKLTVAWYKRILALIKHTD